MTSFTRTDILHCDEIIKALSKLRFDLNAEEVLRLFHSLKWLGEHRSKMAEEINEAEAKDKEDQEKALADYQRLLADASKPKFESVFVAVNPIPDNCQPIKGNRRKPAKKRV